MNLLKKAFINKVIDIGNIYLIKLEKSKFLILSILTMHSLRFFMETVAIKSTFNLQTEMHLRKHNI